MMFLFVALFSVLALISTFFVCIGKRLLLKWKVQSLGIPELKGNPFLGNLLHYLKLSGSEPGVPFPVCVLEALNGFGKLFEREDFFILCPEPTRANVFLCKAESVEQVLSSNIVLNKSTDYEFMKCLLGEGLITSANPKWRKHRKMLTPAFHLRILNRFQPIMYDHSQKLVGQLRKEAAKPFIDPEPFLSDCAMNIILETSLGINSQTEFSKKSSYCKAVTVVNKLLVKRSLSPWLFPDFLFRISPTGKEFKRQKQVIDSFICTLIQEKKKEFLKYNKELLCSEEFQEKTCKNFLEMLIINNINTDAEFGDQDVEDEVQTFTFAGHETTSTTLCWTLYLLGLHQDMQSKVYEELLRVFGEEKDTPPITQDHLRDLDYMDCVIKESQRLYPAVPVIGRHLLEDFTINGYCIPKGTNIGIPIQVLHYDQRYFPNPEVFDPDRFLDTSRHPFAYIPFSAGPRNCIGQRFAMMEMKTVLSNILRNFLVISLIPRDKVLPSFDAVLRPSQPLKIRLEERNYAK